MLRARPLLVCVGLALLAAAPARADDEPKKDENKLPELEPAVKGWTAQEGFLRVYRKEQDARGLLGAVPADLLDKPFLLATSISGGTEYAGWQWEDKLVRFERLDKRLLLVELNVRQRAAAGSPLDDVVRRTYADKLIATLDIKAQGPGGELLIDLSDLLIDDCRTFFGGLFSVRTDVARLVQVKPFPQNLEVALQVPLSGDGTFVTLHYSISQLPTLEDYKPRKADDRIGYFVTAIRDYTEGDPREGRMVRYLNRWKLEKADPALELSPPKQPIVFYVEKTVPIAYRRAVASGILEWNRAFEPLGISGAIEVRQQTETQFADLDPEDVRYNFFRWITSEEAYAMGPSRVDPRNGRILDADIVFDDSMLRGYMADYETLIQKGPEKQLSRPMQAWLAEHPEQHPLRAALERGGAQSPLTQQARRLVREALEELPAVAAIGSSEVKTAPELQRALRARRAGCELGPGVAHQVSLGRLFAQVVLTTAPKGDLERFLEQVVKETVMHEVGHTLGLRHNFKASSWVDLDAVNAAEKPAVLSASVMDYHPLNLSVLEGKPQGHFVTTTVGPYDILALEYGYRLCEETAEELKAIPRKMATQGLPYATDEDLGSPDPLIAQWDLGKDPLRWADYRRGLVQKLWAELETRAVQDDESWARLRRAFDMTLFELGQAGLTCSKLVGGLSFTRDHRGDPGARPPIDTIPVERQREAVKWVCQHVFAPDAFGFPPELLRKLAAGRWSHWGSRDDGARLDYPLLERLNTVQTWALFFLTGDDVLARLWENEQLTPAGQDALTLPELFDLLEKAIFAELDDEARRAGRSARDPLVVSARQNLQDAYVRRLIAIALGGGISPPVAQKLAWSRLEALEARFKGTEAWNLDPYTRAHLDALEAKSHQARTAQFVHVASGGCGLAGSRGGSAAGLPLLGVLGLLLWRRRGTGGRLPA